MTTKALSFNTILNDIELIQNDVDEFVKEIQKTKEGKYLSYEHLKNIFMFWKLKQLQDKINEQQFLLNNNRA